MARSNSSDCLSTVRELLALKNFSMSSSTASNTGELNGTVRHHCDTRRCHPKYSRCHPQLNGCHPKYSRCHPERSEGSHCPPSLQHLTVSSLAQWVSSRAQRRISLSRRVLMRDDSAI